MAKYSPAQLAAIGDAFDRQRDAIAPKLGAKAAGAIAASHVRKKYPGALELLRKKADKERAAGKRPARAKRGEAARPAVKGKVAVGDLRKGDVMVVNGDHLRVINGPRRSKGRVVVRVKAPGMPPAVSLVLQFKPSKHVRLLAHTGQRLRAVAERPRKKASKGLRDFKAKTRAMDRGLRAKRAAARANPAPRRSAGVLAATHYFGR